MRDRLRDLNDARIRATDRLGSWLCAHHCWRLAVPLWRLSGLW
jgi:hypothetical protein